MPDTDIPITSESDETRDLRIMDSGGEGKEKSVNLEGDEGKVEKEEKLPPDDKDDKELVDDINKEELEKEARQLQTDEEQEEESQLKELDAKVSRPSFQEIQKEYPDIFTKFPELREIYHRDAAVFGSTGIFSSVEEAREASSKSNTLDETNNALSQGDFKGVLESLDERTLVNFVEELPSTLGKINPKLFYQLSAPIFSDMLNAAWRKAEKINSENFKHSILNVCEFLYGRQELPKLITSRINDPRLEEERKELDSTRSKIHQEQNYNFQNSTNKIIERRLNDLILDGLDPTNELPEFTKKAIAKEVMDRVVQIVAKDSNLKAELQALFVRAEKRGWPIELKTQIISRYLGRVKGSIASLKSQIKSEALGRRTRPTGPRKLEPRDRSERSSSRGGQQQQRTVSSRSLDPKKVDWRQTSDDDLLSDKVVLK